MMMNKGVIEKNKPFTRAIRESLKQAYIEAPWRKQVRFTVVFLCALISLAVLAWIYLSVSSQAATIGREIQSYRREIIRLQQYDADMEAQIAALSSAVTMNERVEKLNLQPIDPTALVYLTIPGYSPAQAGGALNQRTSVQLQPFSSVVGPLMIPEFSQSWIDLLWAMMKTLEPLYGFPSIMEEKP